MTFKVDDFFILDCSLFMWKNRHFFSGSTSRAFGTPVGCFYSSQHKELCSQNQGDLIGGLILLIPVGPNALSSTKLTVFSSCVAATWRTAVNSNSKSKPPRRMGRRGACQLSSLHFCSRHRSCGLGQKCSTDRTARK